MRHLVWPFLLLAPLAHASSAPLTYEANLPFTRVTINGTEVKALIDTGSFQRVELSSALANKLALEREETSATQTRYTGRGNVQTATVKEFAIGDHKETNARVSIVEGDLERIASQIHVPFEAILGWGFWSQFETELDPEKHLVNFSTSALPARAKRVASFAYRESNRVPVVDGAIDSQETVFLFDTGAPRSTIDAQPGDVAKDRALKLGAFETMLRFEPKDLSAMKKGVHASAVIGNTLLMKYIVQLSPGAHAISLFATMTE